MSYNVSLPSYSVGTDVYKLVGSICAGYGHKAVAIGGHKAMAAVKDKLCKAIIDSDIEISDFIWYGGEASYEMWRILCHLKLSEMQICYLQLAEEKPQIQSRHLRI